MKKRVGILTSGGDCPGLNATIRGVAKALYARMGDNVEIVGILNGYSGLINGDYKEMCEDDFRGILTLGGTILGTKRTPFKMMRVVEDDNVDKVAAMKKTYKAAKLDCLLCLGGNGTHKTANLLSQEGLNIIGLPKTIDNDIYGTDVTFGFHTAVDIATDVIDRIHTTAGSHSRVMCIEIMGNKAGWLTLYSGIAGGADIILLPEQPYDIDRVCDAVERRARKGSNFSIIAVAEGAINCEEAGMKRKEWMHRLCRKKPVWRLVSAFRVTCSAAAAPVPTTVCWPLSLAAMPQSWWRSSAMASLWLWSTVMSPKTVWQILPARPAMCPTAASC